MVSLTFDNKNSEKLRIFSKSSKFDRPAPPDLSAPPQPAPKTNFWERLDLPSNMENSNPLTQVIDKVIDMRYPFLFIVYHVVKMYPSLEQNARPNLTPSSFVAYNLFLLYGYMLVNDYQGRTRPSFWASDFMDSRACKAMYNILLRCYVPPFMMDLFHAMSDTADPRRKGLHYFTSLAACQFETDFGRLIPPQIFLYAHNMSCEGDTSRNVSAAITNLLSWPVFRYGTQQDPIYVAQYFSAGTDIGTYSSWMYQTLDLLFSPVTGKSILRRSNIQSIPSFTSIISIDHTNENVTRNPYAIFLQAGEENVHATMEFLAEFSAFVKSDLKGAYQLGAVPDSLSGVAILNHGYSIYSLPTWHNSPIVESEIFTPITASQYASKIKYLQPKPFVADSTVPRPETEDNLLQALFLRLFKSDRYSKSSDPDKFVKFYSDEHVDPDVMWLSPYEEGDAPIGYAMISGSIIESFELDGTSVPLPNTVEKLSDNNSQFAQGAIPLTHVVKGLGPDEETRIHPLPRATLRRLSQQVSLDLYDLATNRLGYVTGEVADSVVPTALPGFTRTDNVHGFGYIYSKISYILGKELPIGKRRLPVWSPYRIIVNETNSVPPAKQIAMLTNFRAMYGTHVPLIKTRSAHALIPTS